MDKKQLTGTEIRFRYTSLAIINANWDINSAHGELVTQLKDIWKNDD